LRRDDCTDIYLRPSLGPRLLIGKTTLLLPAILRERRRPPHREKTACVDSKLSPLLHRYFSTKIRMQHMLRIQVLPTLNHWCQVEDMRHSSGNVIFKLRLMLQVQLIVIPSLFLLTTMEQ